MKNLTSEEGIYLGRCIRWLAVAVIAFAIANILTSIGLIAHKRDSEKRFVVAEAWENYWAQKQSEEAKTKP